MSNISQNNANVNSNQNGPAPSSSGSFGGTFVAPEGTVPVDNSVYGIVNKLNEDEDLIRTNVEQSQAPGVRNTTNHNLSCNDLPKIQEFSDSNRLRPINGGHECPATVDISSKYRVGVPKSCPKNRNQLLTRPYLTVPYMANGNLSTERMDIESELITGDYEMDTLPLAGVSTLDNVFVPLTPNLRDNIQNPVHLVEETADRLVPNNYRDAWIRGGIPTRQGVKDLDYLERSNDNDYVKELLVKNKGYLF